MVLCKRKGEFFMKKNILIISLIFIIPIVAYFVLTNSGTTTATTAESGKPQVIKFTSSMCLDCQTMNNLFKEIFPKYADKIVLTEIQVQNKDQLADEQIKKYNVTLVPTVIMLNSDGQQTRRIEGAIPKEELEKYLQELN